MSEQNCKKTIINRLKSLAIILLCAVIADCLLMLSRFLTSRYGYLSAYKFSGGFEQLGRGTAKLFAGDRAES